MRRLLPEGRLSQWRTRQHRLRRMGNWPTSCVVEGPLVSPLDGPWAAPRAARRARTEEGGAAFSAAPPVVALTPTGLRAGPETRKPNPQKPLPEAVASFVGPASAASSTRRATPLPMPDSAISHTENIAAHQVLVLPIFPAV